MDKGQDCWMSDKSPLKFEMAYDHIKILYIRKCASVQVHVWYKTTSSDKLINVLGTCPLVLFVRF